jgi:P-type Ca2+ transporter type 2C
MLFPVHIAILELNIDPACSFVFEAEAEEADVMERPPRDPQQPLFGRQTIGMSLLQGFGTLAIISALLVIVLYRGQGALEARAMTFTSLVFTNIALITTNRSWSAGFFSILCRPNAALRWVIGGAILFLGLVLYIPFLRNLFQFSFLHPIDIGVCLIAGLFNIIWFEFLKTVRNRRVISVIPKPS